jgi:hypothetical protein
MSANYLYNESALSLAFSILNLHIASFDSSVLLSRRVNSSTCEDRQECL